MHFMTEPECFMMTYLILIHFNAFFVATKCMFSDSNVVSVFGIPDVSGTACQRYFLGKHEQ